MSKIIDITKVNIINAENANGVADKLLGHFYGDFDKKIAGLFDSDSKGLEQFKKFQDTKFITNSTSQNRLSNVKAFKIEKPEIIISIIKKSLNVDFSIEDTISPNLLKELHNQHPEWFSAREGLRQQNINRPTRSQSFDEWLLSLNLSEIETFIAENKVSDAFKVKFAKFIEKLPDAKFHNATTELLKTTEKLMKHLHPHTS